MRWSATKKTCKRAWESPAPRSTSKSKLDPDTFFTLIDRVVEQHPNIKLVATTLREVHSTNRHDWAAVLWLDGQRYVSPTCQLDVIDRIGGGDGFAAGLIYGLLSGRSPEEALRLGWAHGGAADNLPRRRHHGQAARGGGARQGRLGPRAAIEQPCDCIGDRCPMLTAQGCAARRERLWEALPAPCDILIVGDPSHLIYFAGYCAVAVRVPDGRVGALLLLEPGRATLVADDMLAPFLEQAFVDERVAPVWYDGTALGPASPGPARRIDARPSGDDAGATNRRRAVERSRGRGRGPAAAGPGSRSSTSTRSSVRCGGRKTRTRSTLLRSSMRAGEAAQRRRSTQMSGRG